MSLLSAGQANAVTFREIAANLKGVASLLRSSSPLLPHILPITAYDSGLATAHSQLLLQLEKAIELIEETVALDDNEMLCGDIPSKDQYIRIPDDFFYRNEIDFRGCLNIGKPAYVLKLYHSDERNDTSHVEKACY